jgi:integrase
MTTQHRTAEALAQFGGEHLTQRMAALARPAAALTVKEAIDAYMRVYDGRDPTRTQRLAAWGALIGATPLAQVDNRLVRAVRDTIAEQPALTYKGLDFEGRPIFQPKARARGKSTATLNRYVTAFSAVCSWLLEQDLAPPAWRHPCRGVKRLTESDGRVRFLDDDERTRLLAACKASDYPRLHALALTAILTGARRGELLGLTWRDVDLEAGIAYLAKTKNGDRRTLVLLPAVVQALRPFHSTAPARYVFGSVKSKFTKPAKIDTAWRNAVKRAGLTNYRFHDNRHSFASALAQAGVDLAVVADCLGHRQLVMTKRYAHLKTQTKAAAMAAALGAIR